MQRTWNHIDSFFMRMGHNLSKKDRPIIAQPDPLPNSTYLKDDELRRASSITQDAIQVKIKKSSSTQTIETMAMFKDNQHTCMTQKPKLQRRNTFTKMASCSKEQISRLPQIKPIRKVYRSTPNVSRDPRGSEDKRFTSRTMSERPSPLNIHHQLTPKSNPRPERSPSYFRVY